MPVWGWWMSSHALINGATFYLFTGNIYIGMLETLLHVCIDFAKTENKTNPNIDQILHLLSIVMYLVILWG